MTATTKDRKRWFRGSSHVHTSLSDGDASPGFAKEWYKKAGYDFMVLTDHNINAPENPSNLPDNGFLVIPGQEITIRTSENVPLHVCGLGTTSTISFLHPDDHVEIITRAINEILAQNAVPLVCHPNWEYAFDHRLMSQLPDLTHFEVYNFGYNCNSYGGGPYSSCETMWDCLLSEGRRVFGAASDDAHHYHMFTKLHANPGRGWIMVRAEKLERDHIIEAIRTGNFYFSTGAFIEEISLNDGSFNIYLDRFDPRFRQKEQYYVTQFIGKKGRTLFETRENPAVYKFNGDEMYVRCRTQTADGNCAWTQAVFLDDVK